MSSLVDLQQRLRTFAAERDGEQFHTPKNLSMALAGEVGELLAELQWLTPEESAAVMSDPEAGGRVLAEIGDVVIYLARLADVLGVDLVEAAHRKLDDSARRYPPRAAAIDADVTVGQPEAEARQSAGGRTCDVIPGVTRACS